MKKLLAVIVLLVLAVTGYFAYAKHQASQFTAALIPHVKNVSLRVENTLRLNTDEDSNITFKEIFERLETDVGEIEKRLLDVQTMTTSDRANLATPAIDYLRASQAYLRAELMKYRKRLAYNSSRNWAERKGAELKGASDHSHRFAMDSFSTAIEEMKKAGEELSDAYKDLNKALPKLHAARNDAAKVLPVDALVPVELLDKATKLHAAYFESAAASDVK